MRWPDRCRNSLLSEAYNEAELFAYLKEHIDDNRMPRTIERIGEIPRTYNGKILRKKLAART